MNLDRALEQAHAATTIARAAKLYNNIEYELALGDPSPAQEQGGEQALGVLRDRFPGVAEAAQEIETPPALSRAAGDNLRSGDEKPALTARTRTQHRAERRVGHRTLRSRLSHATAIHARPRRRSGGGLVTPRTRQSASGVGHTIIWAVEGVVGLTLLSLLVSPNGSQALSVFAGGLGKFLGKLANPHDPLFTAHGGTGGSGDVPILLTNLTRKKPPGSGGGKTRLPHFRKWPVIPPAPVRPPVPASPWQLPTDIPVPELP